MTKFYRNIIFFLCVFFTLALLVYPTFAEKKLVRWAADTESGAPYVFPDPRIPNKLIGYEVDIINAIAEELNWELEFVQNQWDGLIPGLQRKDYDIAINGIEITEDRKQEVLFSNPYYLTYEQLVTRLDDNSINTLNDLAGKQAGTLKGSVAERILVSHGGIETLTYDSEVNSFSDLINGRLEAVLIDSPVALYYAGWNPQLKLVGQPIGEVVYGIVIRKEDEELANEINTALSKIITTGKMREILESWNMWNYMMALYLNDKTESKIKPVNYTNFVKSQKKEMEFSDYLERYLSFLPMIGTAALTTIEISLLSMIFAIIFGLILALTRVYAPKPISSLATLYIEIVRGTPLLIQLYFIFYALPSIGIKLSPFSAAIWGLGLNYAAYEAENYRAGLFAVPRGQMEAAISLGMSRAQALRHVIVPQAVRFVIPPVTNDFIALLKDSSLVSVITMVELTKLYGQLSSTYYDYIGTGILIASVYLLLGLPFVKLSKAAEKKLALDNRKIV